ncbi:hypothetical protein [Chryseobacterium sp. HSC-36S06]|uniref:hypothetical protein n=1 Tax=Chryseobacterium sp. HSC-36S06 TaxID=2910970 RepID=UPI0020A1BB9C|nr:hypothetical protein [Chryseobacterium sp. HSC-36S06]MCP2038910.1 putative membrane protein [Chryseobacterium sp. HSC-36S06]
MKKKILNILGISWIVTTIGFVMDGDPTVPGVLLRFTEFFFMLGIVFLILSVFYFRSMFIKNRFRKLIK